MGGLLACVMAGAMNSLTKRNKRAAVVGGGASGMMAAIWLARSGFLVTLYERNEKLGKKLYITGKGRCNLTNACAVEELFQAVQVNSRFLYSAFYSFTNADTMAFFEELGLRLKVERGGRVFPESDHSSDVIRVLEKELKRLSVDIFLETRVCGLLTEKGRISGVRWKRERAETGGEGTAAADLVVVATGGLSYPVTGSTGDGYRFARELGHTVTELSPSLVPILTKEEYIPKLQGLSLRNVELRVFQGKKELFREFGEMMFTHKGVTGPLILTASAVLGKKLAEGKQLQAAIDLKPALSDEQLDARILRDFSENPNRQFKNAAAGLFPSSLLPVMLELGTIPPEKPVHSVTKKERQEFEALIRRFPFTMTGLGSYHEAVITRGGVNVKEVHPGTMESKIVPGLYFAGEVLDLDACTGGYNLQIAWSTAHAAGTAEEGVGKEEMDGDQYRD